MNTDNKFSLESIVLPGPSGITTYTLPGVSGASFISHWSGPAHESSSPGTPYLSVALMPYFEKRKALFNFGNGWRDRYCNDPKAIYLTHPNTPHEWKIDGSVMVVMLSIPLSEVHRILDELQIDRTVLETVKRLAEQGYVDSLIYDLVLSLWSKVRTDSQPNPALVHSSLVCIVNSIAAKCLHAVQHAPDKISGVDLRIVLDIIHDRLHESLNLVDLAAIANLSKYRFMRLFSEATGYTPYQYIQHRRIEKSKILLVRTQLPIGNIGAAVGFGDAPNFSRTFARAVGASPTQYRQSARWPVT